MELKVEGIEQGCAVDADDPIAGFDPQLHRQRRPARRTRRCRADSGPDRRGDRESGLMATGIETRSS
jgi:hypothetical protein